MSKQKQIFKVLIIDDDREMRQSMVHLLSQAGWKVEQTHTAIGVEKIISGFLPDVILSDIRMPGRQGTDLLDQFGGDDTPPVVLISAHGDIPLAVGSIKAGAYSFLEKPFDPMQLIRILEHAARQYKLQKSASRLKARLADLSGLDRILLGSSDLIKSVKEQILDLSTINSTVLLLGETGTGKELAAKAIHDLSSAADAPFIALNCAIIPIQDFEAVTFGHKEDPSGIISQAEGGTLFLDEITSTPPEVQAKLVRFLETKDYTPLGHTVPLKGNIRIIAASNIDLLEAVKNGTLREDFYYRLNGLMVQLPNLRDYKEDIPLLFQHFSQEFGRLYEVKPPLQTADDFAALLAHGWAGNVRELRSIAERSVLAARRGGGSARQALNVIDDSDKSPENLRGAVAAFERALIARSIHSNSGRMDDVARALGIGRRTLNEKIVKLNINKDDLLG